MARRRNTKNKGRNVRTQQREDARQRETLERKWYSRTEFTAELSHLVVQHSGADEPWHRWLPYRQGFAPALVRTFLENGELSSGPILDPFSGSGTTVMESLRTGRPAVGVEALPALSFLTRIRLLTGNNPELAEAIPVFPDNINSAQGAWQAAETPLARACVLMAASRTVKGDGKKRKNLPPFKEILSGCREIIFADISHHPFSAPGAAITGDARHIPFTKNSFGGVLTSPPYLSRYDYARVNRPLEELYENSLGRGRKHQMRAHHKAYERPRSGKIHPAADEAARELRHKGQKKEAGIALSYLDDLHTAIKQICRILKPNAPMMMVVAGANFSGVYVPCDLLAAEFCEETGMEVEEILSVRNLGPFRRLGGLDDVAPREIILSARK